MKAKGVREHGNFKSKRRTEWETRFLSRVEVQASGAVSLKRCLGKATKSSSRDGAKSALEEVGRANPGIEFVELDIDNPKRSSTPKQGFRIARRKVRCSQLLGSLATLAAT